MLDSAVGRAGTQSDVNSMLEVEKVTRFYGILHMIWISRKVHCE